MTANKKIYSTILLSLLSIVLIKLFVPAPYINKELKNEYWTNKTFGKNKTNIVVGGDSRVYRGVSTTHLLDSCQSLTAVNLGYSSAGFNSEYFNFLYDRMDTTSSENIMLLGITPHSFLEKHMSNDALNFYKSKTSSEIFSGLYYAPLLKHFPPYSPFELFDDSTETYIINYRKGGFAASNNLAGDFDYTYWKYWDTFRKEKVSDSLINVFFDDIKRFQDRGVKIIAFQPPVPAHMMEIEDGHSGFKREEFKSRFKNEGGLWIEIVDSLYSSYDGSHLHYRDAEKLSTFLGVKIKELIKDQPK